MKKVSKQRLAVSSVLSAVACVALAGMTATRSVEAATFLTVSNLNDSGAGSLRQAIIDSNTNPGADTIDFQAGLSGTIPLASELPLITGDLTISGPGASVMAVSGNSFLPVFTIQLATVSISGLTITNGKASFGAGIFNNGGILTITGSTFSGNASSSGGGIFNNAGILTITSSTFSGNSATSDGGGIFNLGGTVTITSSTFFGNLAINSGGAISNNSDGTLTVINSTLSGNASSSGGAIRNTGGDTLTVTNSTLFGNSASGAGGGINNSGTAKVKNSIIANSPGGNCAGTAAITPLGVNFSTDNTCAGFTVAPSTGAGGLNLNPLLQDNGGPTLTRALLADSVAIDAVTDCTNVAGNPVTTDQRGVSRPQGSACDVGAFEVQVCTITCPANITVSNALNQCSATVDYIAPTVDPICAAVNCSPVSGSSFFVGTTTVTCTTAAGPSCSFTVTVNDTQPPKITCPANITTSNDPNQCSALVNYAAPPATDNCPNATVTCLPASGSTFTVGTTTVTCTATDASGNTNSCSFTVTVNDTQPSTITCPANLRGNTANLNDPCGTVNFPPPAASDNCTVSSVVCVPPSGSCFPLGTTAVTCTATDTSSNIAMCSFTVTVSNLCLQDDSNPGSVFSGNAATGAYTFCCGGATFTGVAQVNRRGNVVTLTQNTENRRVTATLDGGAFKGAASLQSPPGTTKCTITDRDTRNNSCVCQ
jgi:hypothetical protein